MTKIKVKVKCATCGCMEEDKILNILDKEVPIQWRCPECGATTEINFKDADLSKYELKSDLAARIPKVGRL
jgi:hypothetical protein